MSSDHRQFTRDMSVAGVGFSINTDELRNTSFKEQSFTISLAEWSLNKSLFRNEIDNLDFPELAAKSYDIYTLEYVNLFFKDKAADTFYLNELLKRCNDNNVMNHLIMIDEEGNLGDLNDKVRMLAVENHYKWVDAAKYLGCQAIRVNVRGEGSAEEVKSAAINSLGQLAEYAEKVGVNVIVENHGGYSSNGSWLCDVMKKVDMKNVGTLPDLGNFCLKHENEKCVEEYDRYKGVIEMMPYAKGVSAKSIDFDEEGNCIETDYYRMLEIIKNSEFSGYIGIEYGGDNLTESDGILKTKKLLQKVAAQINYNIK